MGGCLGSLFWAGGHYSKLMSREMEHIITASSKFSANYRKEAFGSFQFCYCCCLELGTNEVGVSLFGTEELKAKTENGKDCTGQSISCCEVVRQAYC